MILTYGFDNICHISHKTDLELYLRMERKDHEILIQVIVILVKPGSVFDGVLDRSNDIDINNNSNSRCVHHELPHHPQ